MGVPAIGELAPEFDLPSVDGEDVSLARYRGDHPVVLLFYPGDFTSVCTKQMCAFRDAYRELVQLGAQVLAVSTDDLDSHARFRQKHRLPFKLLADETGHVARRYGVMGLLGRRARRASFVIDRDGVVRYAKVQLSVFRPSIQEIAAVLSGLERAGLERADLERADGGA